MKNQWPFWLFIIAIFIVVVIAINYQGNQEVAPLGEIFSQEPVGLEYEYVSSPEQKPVAAVAPKVVASSATPDAPKVETALPKAQVTSTSAPVAPASTVAKAADTSTAGSLAVQILSSKDKTATEAALQKVKNNGFPEAYMRQADLGDRGIWYRIYIGQYSSMAQAQEGLAKVKEKYPQAFIFKF